MVNIIINRQKVCVPEGTTILEAAKKIGINIPTLCYLKGINEIGACRVCIVEVAGTSRLVTSCNTPVTEGMEVFTNSARVREARKTNVELILSQHHTNCPTCVRSGNCKLQKVANDLNLVTDEYPIHYAKTRWTTTFPLVRDAGKCIKCMRCVQICDKIQSLNVWDVQNTGSHTTVDVSRGREIKASDCSLCGQCITHCPVGALRERDDTEKVWDAIADEKKTVVVQIAPAVRTAWGEAMGMKREDATVGKILDAWKRMGADYVFDTSFSADLTIMEEATEFLERFQSGSLNNRPMFTSCCPGWLRFVKTQFPEMVSQLSTAKSPQQMFGAVMKTYFAQSIGVDPENIVTVSVMPCVAKKAEADMDFYYKEYAGKDVDIVLTTREFTRMLRETHIRPEVLTDRKPDSLMQEWTGAGVIFGATGGVMEAALRTAYHALSGKNPDPDFFDDIRTVNEDYALTEANLDFNGTTVRTAIVSGLGNTRKLLEAIRRGDVSYDFVEVMACPGGCVGGGGQPICDGKELAGVRGENLHFLDKNSKIRFSHENQDVAKLYQDFLEHPLSHKSHMILHTDHNAWSMHDPE